MSDLLSSLRAAGFGGVLAENVPLAPLTTWKIGGPAEILAIPESAADIAIAASWAAGHDLPWHVLGNGSNLLVSDRGVRGVVLRVRKVLDTIDIRDGTVRAGAGALFPAVAHACAAGGLAGLEFGAGIPGTIGGALVMNAGWHDFETGAHVRRVTCVDRDGETREWSAEKCAFRYRGSRLRDEPPAAILGATFELEPGNPAEIAAKLQEFASSRKANQPTAEPSCGSVFLKPPGDFAGRLIEAAGLKGASVGAATVSPKHANFIVNGGGASSEDVLALVARVEEEVERRFGVTLEREFETW